MTWNYFLQIWITFSLCGCSFETWKFQFWGSSIYLFPLFLMFLVTLSNNPFICQLYFNKAWLKKKSLVKFGVIKINLYIVSYVFYSFSCYVWVFDSLSLSLHMVWGKSSTSFFCMWLYMSQHQVLKIWFFLSNWMVLISVLKITYWPQLCGFLDSQFYSNNWHVCPC